MQTNFVSFPVLPANCLELFVCLGKQEKKELVFCPREGYRSHLWGEKDVGEEWTGLCVLLALESAVGLRCSGGKRKEGEVTSHGNET